jgi:hypothetical protein
LKVKSLKADFDTPNKHHAIGFVQFQLVLFMLRLHLPTEHPAVQTDFPEIRF